MKNLFFAFLTIAGLIFNLYPQSNYKEFLTIYVCLQISADQNIEGEVKSYLSRELRSFSDVLVVDVNQKHDYVLQIVALETKTTSGYKSGIAFSVVTLRSYSPAMIQEVFKEWCGYNKALSKAIETKEHQTIIELHHRISKVDSLIDKYSKDAYYIVDHYLQTGRQEEIQYLCQKIIANFDGEFLNEDRKLKQDMIKWKEEYEQKYPPPLIK